MLWRRLVWMMFRFVKVLSTTLALGGTRTFIARSLRIIQDVETQGACRGGSRKVQNGYLPTAVSRLSKAEAAIWARRFGMVDADSHPREAIISYLFQIPRDALPVGALRVRADSAQSVHVPTCTRCDFPMMIKLNRNTEEPFWGCVDFPHCKGTRPVSPSVAELIEMPRLRNSRRSESSIDRSFETVERPRPSRVPEAPSPIAMTPNAVSSDEMSEDEMAQMVDVAELESQIRRSQRQLRRAQARQEDL